MNHFDCRYSYKTELRDRTRQSSFTSMEDFQRLLGYPLKRRRRDFGSPFPSTFKSTWYNEYTTPTCRPPLTSVRRLTYSLLVSLLSSLRFLRPLWQIPFHCNYSCRSFTISVYLSSPFFFLYPTGSNSFFIKRLVFRFFIMLSEERGECVSSIWVIGLSRHLSFPLVDVILTMSLVSADEGLFSSGVSF